MDSTDGPQQTKKKRLIYDREALLAIKKNATSDGLNIYDTLSRVSASSSANHRGGRGKTRASTISKVPNGSTRDSSNIVLGPQKRTWNTGCHVSQTSGRESDNYGSTPRGGKSGSEYRFLDRSHPRGTSDYKRDFRSGHIVSRDRGVTRRADGTVFCRVQSKDDRYSKEARSTLQEEPEWFSEGPTTVNDTIELGGILEDVDDAVVARTIERSSQQADEVACVGDSKVSTEKAESDLEKKFEHPSHQPGTSREVPHSPVTTISHLNLFDALQIPKTTTSQGSRFKHLFVKSDAETPTVPKGNINDQLLQLLKGSTQGNSLQDKNNVMQVENKLRSILLGHNGSRTSGNHAVTENKSAKPQVLTVEEIEAQLNFPHNQSSEVRPTNNERPTNAAPEKTTDDIIKSFSSIPSVGSNLAPMLQSLALKQQQQQQQQQAACAQSVQLRSALSTIGMLSNPMVRLPTSANAVSASARINQLQQTDLSSPSNLSELSSGQQTIRHMWDGGFQTNQIQSQQLQSANSALNASSPRPIGAPPCLLTDLNSRPIFGHPPVNPSNPNTTAIPRRPIVKVQQSAITHPTYPSLSPLVTSNCNSSSGMSGPNLSDVDRRLLTLALKQQQQQQVNVNGQRGLADSFSDGSAMHSAPPGEMRYPSSCLSQNTGSPLVHPVANTNNSAFLASHTRSTPQSDNALAFLSQLVERDCVTCPRPSTFGSFLNSSMKAKTLEEIEHQEVTSGGSFL